MNQRIKRSQDRKNFSTFATGGFVTQHSRDDDPSVLVPAPQKATGDIKSDPVPGIAKASPFFKPLKEVLPKSKADEAKAIAEASKKVEPASKEDEEESEDE